MTVKSQQTKASPCPHCSKVLDGVTGTGDPFPGAITVCAYCRGLGCFTQSLELRKLEPEELAALDDEERAWLEHIRTGLHHHQEERRILNRFVFNDGEPLDPSVEAKVARGEAAVVGPLCSEGPPPRKWRPALQVRCRKCRRKIWIPKHAPAGPLKLCTECGIDAVKKTVEADA